MNSPLIPLGNFSLIVYFKKSTAVQNWQYLAPDSAKL